MNNVLVLNTEKIKHNFVNSHWNKISTAVQKYFRTLKVEKIILNIFGDIDA